MRNLNSFRNSRLTERSLLDFRREDTGAVTSEERSSVGVVRDASQIRLMAGGEVGGQVALERSAGVCVY